MRHLFYFYIVRYYDPVEEMLEAVDTDAHAVDDMYLDNVIAQLAYKRMSQHYPVVLMG
jgi:hypothetical protein